MIWRLGTGRGLRRRLLRPEPVVLPPALRALSRRLDAGPLRQRQHASGQRSQRAQPRTGLDARRTCHDGDPRGQRGPGELLRRAGDRRADAERELRVRLGLSGERLFGQSIEMLPDGTKVYVQEVAARDYRSFRMSSLYRGHPPLKLRHPEREPASGSCSLTFVVAKVGEMLRPHPVGPHRKTENRPERSSGTGKSPAGSRTTSASRSRPSASPPERSAEPADRRAVDDDLTVDRVSAGRER